MNFNLLVGGGGLVWSVLMVFVVFPLGISMPADVKIAALSPDFWPKIIVLLAGLSSLALLAQGIQQVRSKTTPQTASSKYYPWVRSLRRVSLVFGLIFGIYFLTDYLGMVITCILALWTLMTLAGEKSMIKRICISLGVPLLLFCFFEYVASVPIPLGDLIYEILP